MSFHQSEIILKVKGQLGSFQKELEFVEIVPHLAMVISSSDFCNSENLKTLISQIKKNDCPTLYNLSCLNGDQRNKLTERYREFQLENSVLVRGKDRLNISRFNDSDSETLYIGSSMSDIPGRLKQHLGGGNFRTYSLHLSKWAKNLTYDINFCTYFIRHRQNRELERPLVELIEQALWDHYKPIFGKKSGL